MTDQLALVVLGARGQVGMEVAGLIKEQGRVARLYDRQQCDVTDTQGIRAAISGAKIVINCAAYTAVDKAESEPDIATRVNTVAPWLIAEACRDQGAILLHISTDYVFDGASERPWREDDPVAPINVYGKTKVEGEEQIRSKLPQHIILRTSWVFGAHGHNFVKTMRRLASNRNEISVVADQFGGPTPAASIADALLRIGNFVATQSEPRFGTYHFSGAPAVSWHEFASAILVDKPNLHVNPISTDQFPTPARRPRHSVLNCDRIRDTFGITQPDWHAALPQTIAALNALR